jgi:hypothetical protein
MILCPALQSKLSSERGGIEHNKRRRFHALVAPGIDKKEKAVGPHKRVPKKLSKNRISTEAIYKGGVVVML